MGSGLAVAAGLLEALVRGVALTVEAVCRSMLEAVAEQADNAVVSTSMAALAATTVARPRGRPPLPRHFTTDETTRAGRRLKGQPPLQARAGIGYPALYASVRAGMSIFFMVNIAAVTRATFA